MTEKATSWFRESEAVRQCVLGIVVLAVVATFASRAVYMDEHIFLTIARNALENPLVPSAVIRPSTVTVRILEWLGLPSRAPPLAPASSGDNCPMDAF